MTNFELTQLDALAAVVEEGSFDAAARRLHVTPSAISQRVKAFETAAGSVLVRRSKPTAITEAGVPYLRLAHQVRTLVAEVAQETGGHDAVTVPIAVNGDSLNTWVLPALASLSSTMNFDVRRVDQDHSAELLRQGIVMAAVTTSAEPVQGCTATSLGRMRYRPMCSPEFHRRWFADRPLADSLPSAPVVVFDRTDDLQDRYVMQEAGRPCEGRRHYIPSSADFAEAVRLGLGWAVLLPQQTQSGEAAGDLVNISPGTGVDVRLYWQQWGVKTTALQQLSDTIIDAARSVME